ncbi:hypothetical protein SCRM01_235 [Synechococcus phage S-CRM01]|uniref:hypothetical protein n=1 Tax=Synechococcus phage S-CRM01 TaxID=1026955 RepID=UPI000209E43C|nr:hypothetical protein SCRM01_235 [Synechococcus phage S-CRM01]AEC53181.1 hypothetical protein SCRM01_235 [Synechococcus phage S-CRM01]
MTFHYTAGHDKQGLLHVVPYLNDAWVCIADVAGQMMIVSNPRDFDGSLNWAQNFCGSFCLLP